MNTERMAEPRERPRLKEGYPFPDINSYVVALKNRLHIPEEKFQELRRTRGVKLEGWMSAVQPIEDDRPPVRAKIGSRGVLLSSDIKLPGKITENTPVSQVMQTDALYLAKLKYLREAAPQATSWGRGRTKEKQVKQQINELTSRSIVAGGKIDRISFKEALTSLDKKKMAPALVTATFALASCTGGPKPIEPSPIEPVVTEVAQVPTVEPTATKESPPTPVTIASGRPYPESDVVFLLGAGGLENAEERLRELGAGPDIDKIWAMGVAEMERSGINPENIEWVTELNELAENPSWTTMPRDRSTGHFLFPKITSGSEAGQLVRSGSIFAYLDREIGEDFFDWIELQDPEGVGKVEQRLIGDESGWIVVGAFNTEGKMLFWFNAEKDEWVPASGFIPEGVTKVELKNGEWIVVGSEGNVERKFNTETQEWEVFKRQVGYPEIPGAEGYLSSDVLESLPESQINRLYTLEDAELVEMPFGIGVADMPITYNGVTPIREIIYSEDGEYIASILFVSGIYRGVFSVEPEWAFRMHTYIVLEVPLETGDSQYMFFRIHGGRETYYNLFNVPETGRFDEVEAYRKLTWDNVVEAFTSNRIPVGEQIIIGFDARVINGVSKTTDSLLDAIENNITINIEYTDPADTDVLPYMKFLVVRNQYLPISK